MRVAVWRPATTPGCNILSTHEKDFRSLVFRKIRSNSCVDFCLTVGHANVILDSQSEVHLSTSAAGSPQARQVHWLFLLSRPRGGTPVRKRISLQAISCITCRRITGVILRSCAPVSKFSEGPEWPRFLGLKTAEHFDNMAFTPAMPLRPWADAGPILPQP